MDERRLSRDESAAGGSLLSCTADMVVTMLVGRDYSDPGSIPGASTIVSVYSSSRKDRMKLQVYKYDVVLQDSSFKAACSEAGIPPSRRQVSKWSRGMGAAYKTHHKIPFQPGTPFTRK